MPTVGVKRDLLFAGLGRKFTEEEFADLCFDFGLELDEVTTEKQMTQKESGGQTDAGDEVIYKIDVPANRYDLLCLEGLVRGLLIFQGQMKLPRYESLKAHDGRTQRIVVRPSTAQIRPHVVCAVLRDVTFSQTTYDSFIELQDKLHQNICRKRSLVAIGTHDLDRLQGPFVYDALPPESIKFRALGQQRDHSAVELMQLYSTDSHLKPYLAIIRDSPVYPVITDSRGVVLSMPPIINGEHSKITLQTRNVFIECTATDLTKAQVVLDTVVCMFSQYCRRQFTCEQAEVQLVDGAVVAYPQLQRREHVVRPDEVTRYIGVTDQQLPAERLSTLLTRMGLDSSTRGSGEGQQLLVQVPPTRHDILHACDLIEDAAIAYGYNNIEKTMPRFNSVAVQNPINKLSDQIREQVAQAGFTEALTFSLCSRDDIGAKMLQDIATLPVVQLSNPKALEFQVVRSTLVPGLLKTLAANRKMPLPLKLFEVSDVVMKSQSAETGARNERRLAAVCYGKTSGFEVIHGLLDRMMQVLEVPRRPLHGYSLQPATDVSYFPGRCADLLVNGRRIGRLGVLHPQVIHKFDLNMPCSAFEFSLEPFV